MLVNISHMAPVDFRGLWEYVSDKEATKYVTWKTYRLKQDFKKYFDRALTLRSKPDEILGIYVDNSVIGSAHILATKGNKIKLGFGIARKFWNKGICTTVVNLLLQHIKQNWGAECTEVLADIHKNNLAAIRVVQKNGFRWIAKNVEPDRERYVINISKISTRDFIKAAFITGLKKDPRVEALYILGSEAKNEINSHSDVDFLVVVDEESTLPTICSETKNLAQNCGKFIGQHKFAPQHYFYVFSDNVYLDVNFVSTAFLWAEKEAIPIFDKRRFLAKSISSDNAVNELFLGGMISVGRAISKYKNKDYWVIPRFLTAARENSILPLIALVGEGNIKNKVQVDISSINNRIRAPLISTFVKPNQNDTRNGIWATLKILDVMCKSEKISPDLKREFKLLQQNGELIKHGRN